MLRHRKNSGSVPEEHEQNTEEHEQNTKEHEKRTFEGDCRKIKRIISIWSRIIGRILEDEGEGF